MTQEEKRIKLAEAGGWQHYHENLWVDPKASDDPDGFSELWCGDLPDYFHDLNATHKLEKTFTDDDAMTEKYWLTLYDVTQTTRWPYDATAAERSEAIGRTLKLW